MHWLLPALIAPAVYAATVFVDKYVVEHKVKDVRGIPIFSAIAAGTFGIVLWFILGRPILSLNNTTLLMLSGLSSISALAFYFYALSKSHASYINAVFQMIPVFLLIMALVFLGEHLAVIQVIGFFVILAAVLGLSAEKGSTRFRLNKAFWAMVASDLLFATASILIKFSTNLTDFGSILIYEALGLGFGGIILFTCVPMIRNAFLTTFKSTGKPTMGIMFFNEGLFIVAKALSFLAIVLGPVSLVGVLGGTQVFYGLVYGVVLTLLWPRLFHESIVKREIGIKVLLTLVLFTGVLLITWA